MSSVGAGYRRGGMAHRPTTQIAICWLGAFGFMDNGDPVAKCDGRLVRCHLIPKQKIAKAGGRVWDRRSWVWGCGGPTGVGGHHGQLDSSRTLHIPRACLPAGLEELAMELGLLWWLDQTYGVRSQHA